MLFSDYRVVKPGQFCNPDQSEYLDIRETALECSKACKNFKSDGKQCKYFAYGNKNSQDKKGKCYAQCKDGEQNCICRFELGIDYYENLRKY